MLNKIKTLFTRNTTATVMDFESGNGFGLFSPNGELIGKYTRKRDAIRGAQRRGLTVA